MDRVLDGTYWGQTGDFVDDHGLQLKLAAPGLGLNEQWTMQQAP